MKTLKELYLEAARVAELEEQYPGIYPIKYRGKFYNVASLISSHINWLPYISEIEFALAVVENKSVFKGDVLYDENGNRYPIQTYSLSNGVSYLNGWNIKKWSWNPPKPKTVMVEMLVEAAEFMVSAYGVETKSKSATSEVAESCRKALEGLKS